MRTILDQLLRKPVEIYANGFIYRGILIEVTAQELTVRGPAGFFSVPMERVTSVRDPQAKLATGIRTHVDPSFYTADETPPEKETKEVENKAEKKEEPTKS